MFLINVYYVSTVIGADFWKNILNPGRRIYVIQFHTRFPASAPKCTVDVFRNQFILQIPYYLVNSRDDY